MQQSILSDADQTKHTLTHLWQTRGAWNQFPLVVRTTDNVLFLVMHEVERRYNENQTKFIGVCQGHAHLLDDEEIYRKASPTESQHAYASLNLEQPERDNYKPDALAYRWMYENGSSKDASITDYFAAYALAGLTMNHYAMPRDEQTLARKSYDLAEAMVLERSKRYTRR